jgi:iron complex transport system ATP-binding protein
MIRASSITKSYGDTIVVDDVTVTIPACGITSIVGPNGAGKSTFLSIVSRLLAMDRGTVTVDGLDVTRTPSDQLARRLSILKQENHLSSRLTVRDLVSFGRYPYSKGRLTAEDEVHVARSIDYLNLGPLAERYLDELSGGQRQRAFVAMVLCQDTDYVLLDEPLNNLDMKHARAMMKILRSAANELGKTVVLVLHDINFAGWYSDHIVALRDGKLLVSGPVDSVIREDVLRGIFDTDIQVEEIGGRRVCLYYE